MGLRQCEEIAGLVGAHSYLHRSLEHQVGAFANSRKELPEPTNAGFVLETPW